MKYLVDKSLERIYVDMVALRDNFAKKDGIVAMYKYLIENVGCLNSAVDSFSNRSETKYDKVFQSGKTYITSRFNNKRTAESFLPLLVLSATKKESTA